MPRLEARACRSEHSGVGNRADAGPRRREIGCEAGGVVTTLRLCTAAGGGGGVAARRGIGVALRGKRGKPVKTIEQAKALKGFTDEAWKALFDVHQARMVAALDALEERQKVLADFQAGKTL